MKLMLALMSLLWVQPFTTAAPLTFERSQEVLFSKSLQMDIVNQELNRLKEEEPLAMGQFYDPMLRANYFNNYRGYYENRRHEVALLQRLPLTGALVTVAHRRGLGFFPEYDGKWITQDGGELRAGIELPLLRNLWIDPLRANIEKGKRSTDLAKVQSTALALDLLRTLNQRYWDWYMSGHRLSIFKNLLDLARQRQSQIIKRVEHGELPRIEITEGERIILQRESQWISADRSFLKSRMDFLSFLGNSPDLGMLDTSQIPKDSWTQMNEELENESPATEHPEVLREKIITEQASIDRKLSENQLFPRLDLFWNTSQDTGTPIATLNPAQSEVGVQFEFPLPNRAARARKAQAVANEIRAETRTELTKIRIENQFQDARGAVQFQNSRVAISLKEVEVAKKLAVAEQTRFLNGDSNLIFLNIREQNAAEAEIRNLEAWVDLRRSLTDFCVASGKLQCGNPQ